MHVTYIFNKRQIRDATGKISNCLFHGCCTNAGTEVLKEIKEFSVKPVNFILEATSGNFDTN
jgi:hypothetical protein